MNTVYHNTDNNQGRSAITSKKDDVVRDFVRLYLPHIRELLLRIQETQEGTPFFIKTNTFNTAHLDMARHIRKARYKRVKKQVTTVCAQSGSLSQVHNERLIFQESPLRISGIKYQHLPSFTHSLQSYELYAKKHYIQLIRNLDYTKQYPDYHVIVNFYKRMPIKDFSEKRIKAFGYLARWGVSGHYVLEPTPSRNWLHVHMLAMYGRSRSDLRECIKLAFMFAGLTYDRDFHVKVFSVAKTDKDYRRLCAYILKFNGKRKTNLYTPVLFIKGLGLRKTGSFGKWFTKTKGELWKEYREELRLKHERQAWLDFSKRIVCLCLYLGHPSEYAWLPSCPFPAWTGLYCRITIDRVARGAIISIP